MFKLVFLWAISYAASVCPEPTFCVDATVSATEVCFTVNSDANGWAGIGIGSATMTGSEMYVGWKNNAGGYTVGNYVGKGHTRPPVGSITPRVIPATPKPFAKLSFSFCRPLSSGYSVASTQKFIYASSPTAPTGNLDTTAATFGVHTDGFGSFSLNPSSNAAGTVETGFGKTPFLKPTESFSLMKIYLIHGIVMWIAWIVSPFAGIFIARYLKSALGHNWFVLHRLLLGPVTIGLSFLSFVLIFLYRALLKSGSKLETTHVILGFIIVIAMFVQGYLGYIADKKFDLNRTAIPLRDKLHWYIGRALFLAGIINVTLGIFVYEDDGYYVSNAIKAGHFAVLALGIAAFVYGERKYGQDNHLVK